MKFPHAQLSDMMEKAEDAEAHVIVTASPTTF